MSAATLTQINIYPVKSVGGIAMSTAWVEKQGLSFDRRFMVANADGSMVTARKNPAMVLVKSSLLPDGIIFRYPDLEPLKLSYNAFKMQKSDATVWSDTFTAYTTTDEADDWFSKVLGHRVELLYTGEQSNRIRPKIGHNVSFADGYPVLVISENSLEELNRRSSEEHSMDQFRTNLVVKGDKPFVEDTWKRIRIGEVEFEARKPCQRCILTTVDVETGSLRANKEPLKTFSQFRADEAGEVFFGQNLIALNEGMIHQGDEIEVLEYKDAEVYADNTPATFQFVCVEREEIAKDFVTFWLESEHHKELNYLPGQHLPIELKIDGKKVARRYTLSSSPSRKGRLAISVKRVDGGHVSNWLLDNLQVGDVLEAQTPEGNFKLVEHESPLLLLSAGSGVTPMLSMLRYLADHNQVNDVVFYHQCRTIEDIPCREEIEKLNQAHQGLRVIISLTQPPIDWFGLKGRFSLSHLKQVPNVSDRQVFVCGPDGFMNKAKNLLLKQGLPENAYHQEAFGISAPAARKEQAVNITLNGTVIEGTNQKTILEQAEDAGLYIANSCRAGLCGACRVTVKSGKVDQEDVPALQAMGENTNMVLTCCSTPLTDVELTT